MMTAPPRRNVEQLSAELRIALPGKARRKNCTSPIHRVPTHVRRIVEVCARWWHVTPEAILGRSRLTTPSQARQAAMTLAYELTSMSLEEIGRAFHRDHSTVLHACRQVQRRREASQDYAEAWGVILGEARTAMVPRDVDFAVGD